MIKKKFDVVATIGKYTDHQGNEKKRYQNVGAAFEDDKGRLSIKLDTIPITPDWSGWLACYEPDRERNQGQSRQTTTQDDHNRAKSNGYAPEQEDEDDIPF